MVTLEARPPATVEHLILQQRTIAISDDSVSSAQSRQASVDISSAQNEQRSRWMDGWMDLLESIRWHSKDSHTARESGGARERGRDADKQAVNLLALWLTVLLIHCPHPCRIASEPHPLTFCDVAATQSAAATLPNTGQQNRKQVIRSHLNWTRRE